jgi:hypothetical protein
VAFDNVSRIPDWLSDALCRLSTGGGFGTRELYTNDEEILLAIQRPTLINGIDEILSRPDLLDRSIHIEPRLIAEHNRVSERELWAKFNQLAPGILAVLLDGVSEGIKSLAKGLGPKDVAKLNEYFENVREIERQIVQAEKQRAEHSVEAPETPSGIPEDWVKHVKLMFDLQALAFQGNMTRVQSFMLSRELSTLSYPFLGVQDGHHPISHNNNVPSR